MWYLVLQSNIYGRDGLLDSVWGTGSRFMFCNDKSIISTALWPNKFLTEELPEIKTGGSSIKIV